MGRARGLPQLVSPVRVGAGGEARTLMGLSPRGISRRLLTRCPFPFPRVTGSDRVVRGLWTPRWTPVRPRRPASLIESGLRTTRGASVKQPQPQRLDSYERVSGKPGAVQLTEAAGGCA